MDDNRFEIFKNRFEINSDIFVYTDSVDDLYEFVNFMEKSRHNFQPKYNDVKTFVEQRGLGNNQRYCIIIKPNDTKYFLDSFGISALEI